MFFIEITDSLKDMEKCAHNVCEYVKANITQEMRFYVNK